MKIKCPKCKEDAELAPDFSLVTCTKCNLEISYGEYVRYIAHSDAKYSDILGDYAVVLRVKHLVVWMNGTNVRM